MAIKYTVEVIILYNVLVSVRADGNMIVLAVFSTTYLRQIIRCDSQLFDYFLLVL